MDTAGGDQTSSGKARKRSSSSGGSKRHSRGGSSAANAGSEAAGQQLEHLVQQLEQGLARAGDGDAEAVLALLDDAIRARRGSGGGHEATKLKNGTKQKHASNKIEADGDSSDDDDDYPDEVKKPNRTKAKAKAKTKAVPPGKGMGNQSRSDSDDDDDDDDDGEDSSDDDVLALMRSMMGADSSGKAIRAGAGKRGKKAKGTNRDYFIVQRPAGREPRIYFIGDSTFRQTAEGMRQSTKQQLEQIDQFDGSAYGFSKEKPMSKQYRRTLRRNILASSYLTTAYTPMGNPYKVRLPILTDAQLKPSPQAESLANLVRVYTNQAVTYGLDRDVLWLAYHRLRAMRRQLQLYDRFKDTLSPITVMGEVVPLKQHAPADTTVMPPSTLLQHGSSGQRRSSGRRGSTSSSKAKKTTAAVAGAERQAQAQTPTQVLRQYVASGSEAQDISNAMHLRQAAEAVAAAAGESADSVVPKPGERLQTPALDALLTWIEAEYETKIAESKSLLSKGVCNFEALGFLYQPGSMVYTPGSSIATSTGFQVQHSQFTVQTLAFGQLIMTLHLTLRFLAGFGSFFGISEFEYQMMQFPGVRTIHSLPIVPMPPDLQDKLVQRGRLYLPLTLGAHYKAYGPSYFRALPSNSPYRTSHEKLSEEVLLEDGRIMLDNRISYRNGVVASANTLFHANTAYSEACSFASTVHQAEQQGGDASSSLSNDHFGKQMQLLKRIPEHLLAIAWPAIAGYSFTAKRWGTVMVSGIREIVFEKDAFHKLVLRAETKQLIHALITHSSRTFGDLISKKGTGTVFLLHGPPGVGKTLTAEAIAEVMERPLYYLSVGELGTSPDMVESQLSGVLDLCTHWQALVLMDEADIFMEKRRKSEVLRNAMVSVLLRKIEYHRGVLFLTTNRVKEFDPAFQSRVTVALRYDALSQESRQQVWGNLIAAADVDAQRRGSDAIDLASLAGINVNGRQIKNAIRLAQALSFEAKRQVRHSDILHALKIGVDFDRDFEASKKPILPDHFKA